MIILYICVFFQPENILKSQHNLESNEVGFYTIMKGVSNPTKRITYLVILYLHINSLSFILVLGNVSDYDHYNLLLVEHKQM